MTQYQTNLQNVNHFISIEAAQSLIERFASNRNDIIDGNFSEADPFSSCSTFDKTSIISLLNQDGCIGLRIYSGMYDDLTTEEKKGKIVFVLCGVDENGNDLNLDPETEETDQLIMEDALLCPPLCPDPSLINCL